MTDEATLIVDYKGTIQQKIKEVGASCTNWSEGFILADRGITIYKYEDQQYKEKFHFDNFHDKEI